VARFRAQGYEPLGYTRYDRGHASPGWGLAAVLHLHLTPAVGDQPWRTQGVVVLRPEDVRDDWTRQALINEANRLYGCRPGGAR
jgi:hypothetical protein